MTITILDLNVDITLYNITRTIPKTVHIVSTSVSVSFCKYLNHKHDNISNHHLTANPRREVRRIMEFCIQLKNNIIQTEKIRHVNAFMWDICVYMYYFGELLFYLPIFGLDLFWWALSLRQPQLTVIWTLYFTTELQLATTRPYKLEALDVYPETV